MKCSQRRLRSLTRISLSVAAIFFTLTISAWAQSGGPVHRGVQYMRGAAPNRADSAGTTAAANPENVTYNGGQVLPSSTTYAFWWGLPSDFPPDAQEGIHEFLEGLDGSDYLQIADQYMFGQKAHTHFGGDLFDYSAPPAQPVDLTTGYFSLAPEICKVLNANGQKPDPDGLYVIYASNFPNQSSYCAFHGWDTCSESTSLMHISYIPNSAFAPGCETSYDPLFTPNKYSEATRAIVSSTAHEFMESITDPNLDAWYNPTSGYEIGDPCNFIFQSWVPLTDRSRWKIQGIWSNEAGGCVQGAGRDARILGAFSKSGAITSFDIPAAIYGTFGQSVNLFGATTGYYTDATHEFHAFLRDGHGNISTIDPPSTGPGFYGGAQATSINAKGEVAGNFGDTNFVLHGFVRDSKGDFVTIDVAGAAFAIANSINDKSLVAGFYVDVNSVNHGFVRDTLGNIATFDAPGAANAVFGGITPLSINAAGAVTGNYLDANFLSHGFVRHADGTMATFDAPGASQGTFAQSINDFGAIAGYYTDANFVSHGFVRDALGHITTFDDPNATSGGTFSLSINALGAIGGYYTDDSGFPQSFVRDVSGRFYGLSVPGESYGTVVRSINLLGATAGYDTAATP